MPRALAIPALSATRSRRYGGLSYAYLLKAMGLGNEGSPRTMAL